MGKFKYLVFLSSVTMWSQFVLGIIMVLKLKMRKVMISVKLFWIIMALEREAVML